MKPPTVSPTPLPKLITPSFTLLAAFEAKSPTELATPLIPDPTLLATPDIALPADFRPFLIPPFVVFSMLLTSTESFETTPIFFPSEPYTSY